MIVEFNFEQKQIDSDDMKRLVLFLYRFKKVDRLALSCKQESPLFIFDLEVKGKKYRAVEPTFSFALSTLWKYCKDDVDGK